MPLEFYYFCFFLFGLIFGSFANVLILRIPQEQSIVPRSHCPKCSHSIGWQDNIPILSWLWLKGKCRHCRTKISFRYPLIELMSGVLFVSIFHQYGFSYYTFELLIFAYFAFVAAWIDVDHMILPDVFTLGGCVIGLVGAMLNPERNFYDALFGLLLGGGFFFLIAYVGELIYKREAMGGGDIKLLAWIGSVLGLNSIMYTVAVSAFIGVFFGLVRLVLFRKSLRDPVPYGPFLVIASFCYFLCDIPTMVQWFLFLPLQP
ncbi:MAG: prepilin peptidase [Bdellovibrionaceae bacterium]|nr:prepilin peptidase [Pseudobdellovibrionaceae bacterium]